MFQLNVRLLSNKMEKDEDGSGSDSGKRRQKRRRSEAGCAARRAAAQAPAPGEEQTPWPAFVENPLFLPNPKHAEIFIRENKTIKNSQIIENIS